MHPAKYRIMVVAGEASGDAHAAKLVRAIRDLAPAAEIEFFGAVSRQMRSAGVEEIVDADGLAIIGLPEIARALPTFLRAFNKLKAAAAERRPDAAILVDFPEFNLKLARSLKKKGIKVVYYISPQLWAWRKYRKRTIRKYVDLLITILPFEKDWYTEQGITNVEYVGSPLAREVHADSTREEFCARHGIDPSRPIVSLLPGSRHKEIVRILPGMLEAASIVAEANPSFQFVIALASVRSKAEVNDAVETFAASGKQLPETLITVRDETFDALNASDAAAVASGTATLETGIIGTPMAIVYRGSQLNYKLLRPLITVEHFGLINLIAGERVAKELIQDDFTPQALAVELLELLAPEENRRMRARLSAAAEKLGQGGASKRAAAHIIELIGESVSE